MLKMNPFKNYIFLNYYSSSKQRYCGGIYFFTIWYKYAPNYFSRFLSSNIFYDEINIHDFLSYSVSADFQGLLVESI